MHKIFETSIYQNKIPFDLNDLKSECLQIKNADIVGQKWSSRHYPEGYTSYGSWDQLHLLSSNFLKLEKKIAFHVSKYTKLLGYDLGRDKLMVNSFWLNIMPPGSQHTAHIHPNSVISGTFYVQVPKGASSIKFEDPRLGYFMNTPRVKITQKYPVPRFYSIQPKAGQIILFESWLRHEVPRNTTGEPRISVSFNYS
jgi:uncharacterized protein (TIGR02466 family)